MNHRVRAMCEDGTERSATLSPNGADTFFSTPASVRARGKTVTGFVTRSGNSYEFTANSYGKNAGAINDH